MNTAKFAFNAALAALADLRPTGYSLSTEGMDAHDSAHAAMLDRHADTLREIDMELTDEERTEMLGLLERSLPVRATMEHIEHAFARECERREIERVEGCVRFPRRSPHVNPDGPLEAA